MLTAVSAHHSRPVQVVCCVLLPVVCSICVPQLLSADADADADHLFSLWGAFHCIQFNPISYNQIKLM